MKKLILFILIFISFKSYSQTPPAPYKVAGNQVYIDNSSGILDSIKVALYFGSQGYKEILTIARANKLLSFKANDANVFHRTGNETGSGYKTFTDGIFIRNGNSYPFSGMSAIDGVFSFDNPNSNVALFKDYLAFTKNGTTTPLTLSLKVPTLTSGRVVNLQDANGTVALLENLTGFANDANVIHKIGYSSQIIQGELTTEALLLGTAGLTRMGFAQNANIAEWRFYEPVGTNGGYSISHIPGTNLFEFGSKADFTGAPIQQGGIFNYKGILRAEQTPIGSTDVVRLQEISGLALDNNVIHKTGYSLQNIEGGIHLEGNLSINGDNFSYPNINGGDYDGGYDKFLVINTTAFGGRIQYVTASSLFSNLNYAKKDSVIKNQTAVTQNANFKISGDGTVGKSYVGDTTRMIQVFVKGTSITRAVGSANIIETDSGYVYKLGRIKGLYMSSNGLSGRHTQAVSASDSSFYSTRNSIPIYKPGNYLMFELLVNDAISDSTIYTPATFRVQMDSVVVAAIRKGWPTNHLILANTAYFNPPTALTFPNTEYRYSLFAAQMQAEATTRGTLIYDDYIGFKTLYQADNTLLFTDVLHPTPKGHTVIAQRFSTWFSSYLSTINLKTPITRISSTQEIYGDILGRQTIEGYNINVLNDLKTNSIISPNSLPIVVGSPLNTTVDVQTGTDNAAGRAFIANNIIYSGMGVSTSVANWKARFNSKGVALSSVTTSGGLFMMGTTTPNNTTTFKPEISAYRAAGTRVYPEFTFRQHTTADLGFELLSGNGVRTPRIVLTGEYGATISKVKIGDSTKLVLATLPITSTQGSLLVRNTSGDIEQVQITGLIKGNGTVAPTPAVANTDYLPVASPAMTGIPTAPTATVGTNTTQLATTAYVDRVKYLKLTGSGTGAATTISIPHGLTGVTSTSIVSASATTTAAGGWNSITTDATNINFIYTTAPITGTNNLTYNVIIRP